MISKTADFESLPKKFKEIESYDELAIYIKDNYPDSIGMSVNKSYFDQKKPKKICMVVFENENFLKIDPKAPTELFYWEFQKAN